MICQQILCKQQILNACDRSTGSSRGTTRLLITRSRHLQRIWCKQILSSHLLFQPSSRKDCSNQEPTLELWGLSVEELGSRLGHCFVVMPDGNLLADDSGVGWSRLVAHHFTHRLQALCNLVLHPALLHGVVVTNHLQMKVHHAAHLVS